MKASTDALITVGIPAYKANKTLLDALASIQIQSIRDQVAVIIAPDDPEDAYLELVERFSDLNIRVLGCESNTGPGLARQRALDACATPWITFMDADDVLFSPYALEMFKNNITPNCIEVQGAFLQECEDGNISALDRQHIMQQGGQVPPRTLARNDVGHPWVFGRCYNTAFLKNNKIRFSQLRAMEDGEFNWKIRMTIEGTNLQINRIEDAVYLWRTGSEHSITRIGTEQNDGIPLYNWDLCPVGSTAAAINAIKFCKKRNPFNGSISRFTVETMIRCYLTYVQCVDRRPMFAEQNLFNAKRFYHSCFSHIEEEIDDEVLKNMYTVQYAMNSQDMIGIIPSITFFDFMKKLKEDEYRGKEEFDEIRTKLPNWVHELDKKSGVLGAEGYIYTVGENS